MVARDAETSVELAAWAVRVEEVMAEIKRMESKTINLRCDRCGGPRVKRSISLCRRCSERPWAPTPDEIAAECLEIQKTWDRSRWAHETGGVEAACTREVHAPWMDQE